MLQLFLEELLESWRRGQLTLAELHHCWTTSGLTTVQLIETLVAIMRSQAQQIQSLERQLTARYTDQV